MIITYDQLIKILDRNLFHYDKEDVNNLIESKICFITGAGSIGSETCRKLVELNPKQIHIIENYENNAYEIKRDLMSFHALRSEIYIHITNIQNIEMINYLFKRYHPDIVIHTAAYKHVQLVEDNIVEAVKNNILGTYNIAHAAYKYNCKCFILCSSDKAVNPINFMGMTKRCGEMIVHYFSQLTDKTKFLAVRFGNIWGSNGSVIPLFIKQIDNGGPVTISNKYATRFFLTITEAAQLIIYSSVFAKSGKVISLNINKPINILEIAKKLIEWQKEKYDKEIEIKFTNLNSYEKIHEELLYDYEKETCEFIHPQIISCNIKSNSVKFKEMLDELILLANMNKLEQLYKIIKEMC